MRLKINLMMWTDSAERTGEQHYIVRNCDIAYIYCVIYSWILHLGPHRARKALLNPPDVADSPAVRRRE